MNLFFLCVLYICNHKRRLFFFQDDYPSPRNTTHTRPIFFILHETQEWKIKQFKLIGNGNFGFYTPGEIIFQSIHRGKNLNWSIQTNRVFLESKGRTLYSFLGYCFTYKKKSKTNQFKILIILICFYLYKFVFVIRFVLQLQPFCFIF